MKPDVLSDEGIGRAIESIDVIDCIVNKCKGKDMFLDSAKMVALQNKAIAQAQRDADVKW